MKIIRTKATNGDREPVEQPRIPSFIFVSVVVGTVLTTLFYMLVVQLIYRGTYIETIFTERGPIPYMTTYFAFVALAQLLGLFWHLRRESRTLELVSDVLGRRSKVDIESAAPIRNEIYSYLKPSGQKGLLISRVRRVLHRVENKGKSSDVAALLSEQAEIDRAILSNSFSAIRFIVWLIPILGFIGTIYGISAAIAEFPALFDRASENVDNQLGSITKYLGVAFETTLLALIEVAIVQFVVFAVQKRGSQLLNASDEFCLDNLLGKVPHSGLIDEDDLPTSLRHFARILLHHVETMEERFELAVRQVVDKLVENERHRWSSFTDSFRSVAGEHEALIRQTCDSIKDKSEVLTGELRDFEPRLRAALHDVTKELKEIESQHIQQVAIALTDAGDRTSQSLVQAGQDNASALQTASEELRRGMKDIEDLLKTSDELQTMQQTLHSNLAALTQMDQVRTTLQDMSECTQRLIPVLRELQKRRRMQVRIEDEFEEQFNRAPSDGSEDQEE
jgi:biopolymer transport protein ExbB/TolQ